MPKKILNNFPWRVFVISLVLLGFSILFKACDVAAVAVVIGCGGSVVVWLYNISLDVKTKKRLANFKNREE